MPLLTAASSLLAVLACLAAVLAWRRVNVLERHVGLPRRSPGEPARLQTSDGALQHVAVVRYDAFADVAGRLSFSAALVDDAGEGLVISAIHGRGESRTYAKSVEGGTGAAELTPEERQAVAAARAGKQAP